jgi:hypothetical protein
MWFVTIFARGESNKMMNVPMIVEQLRKERDRVEKQLSGLNAALTAFVGAYSGSDKPRMSAAARRRMSLAQKARRAKESHGHAVTTPKRTMSASARRKIAAAKKAWWAAKRKTGKRTA